MLGAAALILKNEFSLFYIIPVADTITKRNSLLIFQLKLLIGTCTIAACLLIFRIFYLSQWLITSGMSLYVITEQLPTTVWKPVLLMTSNKWF